jgi:hypothetical protein
MRLADGGIQAMGPALTGARHAGPKAGARLSRGEVLVAGHVGTHRLAPVSGHRGTGGAQASAPNRALVTWGPTHPAQLPAPGLPARWCGPAELFEANPRRRRLPEALTSSTQDQAGIVRGLLAVVGRAQGEAEDGVVLVGSEDLPVGVPSPDLELAPVDE